MILANGSVRLVGPAPLVAMEMVLQSLEYALDASLEPPCPLAREVWVTVYSGRYSLTPSHLHTLTPSLPHSHPPQNLSTPLRILVEPSNDNPPTVTILTPSHIYTENGPPLPALTTLTLDDLDESCDTKLLIAARVFVETSASDSEYDRLAVGVVYIYISVLFIEYMYMYVMFVLILGGGF